MRTAAYARYSSDGQREASIEDQLRNVRAYCQRAGWPEPTVWSDAAVTGARIDRLQYRQMMEAAEAGRFDVLLVDDIYRLARDHIETGRAVRMLKYWGVHLIGVSDGIDTSRKSSKIEVGMRGLMGEVYLDDLAEKTHRGLMGQALRGRSAGGLPYGYRSIEAAGGDGHDRAVAPEQADWVRQIFEWYVAGKSPREIAAELNRQKVPAPRGGTWAMTAIYADKRGIGILGNAAYIGLWVWNRSHWVKDPISGRRRRQERPKSEWVTSERPDLRIVSQELWDAALARQKALQHRTRAAQATGGPRARAGRGPKFLFSGLLRCGLCGGSYVVVDRYRYGCGTHKDRGPAACTNAEKVPRATVETMLLAGIQQEMLSEDAYRVFEAGARVALQAAQQIPRQAEQRLQQAQRERDNIMNAIRAGIVTASTKEALEAAEAAVLESEAELSALRRYAPAQMLPRARDIWRGMVERLNEVEDVTTAREAIKELLGEEIRLVPEGGGLVAEIAGGLGTACKINVVAGAGFEPTTFGL